MTDTSQDERSKFEQGLVGLSADQFERVAASVKQEADRRNDPMKRIASMTDREFQEFRDNLGL